MEVPHLKLLIITWQTAEFPSGESWKWFQTQLRFTEDWEWLGQVAVEVEVPWLVTWPSDSRSMTWKLVLDGLDGFLDGLQAVWRVVTGRCGILKCWNLKNYFFYSFSLFFLSFSIFSHTTGQKSAYLIGETDSTAQFTLWTPWTATSQTPWIRSYTPSLATISTYHQPPLSFTQHNLYTTSTYYILHTGQPPHTLNHMDMHDACGLMQSKLVDFPRSDLI